MMDWPLVAAYLGTVALGLGFYAVRTSAAGRAASINALDERIAKLERRPDGPVPVMPRGLPGRIPG